MWLVDLLKNLFKGSNSSDGKYIVCDVYHENYSPERLLYYRDYLKKFDPNIMEIDGKQRLVISIDKDLDYNLLYDYEYKLNNIAEINILADKNVDKRVSGYIFFS